MYIVELTFGTITISSVNYGKISATVQDYTHVNRHSKNKNDE